MAVCFVFGTEVIAVTMTGMVASFTTIAGGRCSRVYESIGTIDIMTALVPFVNFQELVEIRAFQRVESKPMGMGRFVPLCDFWPVMSEALRECALGITSGVGFRF
jgi:hypothetical protein